MGGSGRGRGTAGEGEREKEREKEIPLQRHGSAKARKQHGHDSTKRASERNDTVKTLQRERVKVRETGEMEGKDARIETTKKKQFTNRWNCRFEFAV